MTYRIRITSSAKSDAASYASFIRNENQAKTAAKAWLDGIHTEIMKLSDFPLKFAIIPEAHELGFPYRSFNYHSHRVIYSIYKDEEIIIIHRIWHSARPFSGNDIIF